MKNGGDGADATYLGTPSYAVVEAVADAEGVPPKELCPPEYQALHEVVDPQALDALFADRHDGTPRANGRVTFTFCGYRVTVTDGGAVELEAE
ncbi:HalOD1 output domain-containing protein [Salinilacihabitans rarus]|uniref:HalOD1 output domain-containing protein n=1 Tax=Salinilacihabitans rarus TaxID=2961596 RepID=UPI0020C8909F|nr:HalOD1 output domain-containing protein [Salinilacihabitans rarus]